MALKNFIKEGTYTYVEHVAYSKQNRSIQFTLIVKDKDEVIFRTPMNVIANFLSVKVDKIVNDVDDLLDMAPEFLNIQEGENYLIKIKDPTNEYVIDINNKIMSKSNGKLSVNIPAYYYIPSTKETFALSENAEYVKMPDHKIETYQQFDNFFDPANILPCVYKYLKSMPIFANCIDA